MLLYQIHRKKRRGDETSSILELEEKSLVFVAFWEADTKCVMNAVGYNY